ncbi:MAG: magnesium and cobalt transport protein CorA [Bacteroidia bacterium]|nr:magnesium and cobalt transport protein CorA [Bacteroidia bacterium]MBT8253257.1 magnesium and cobalt transport protein CorA [Bacteroidia bacterium]
MEQDFLSQTSLITYNKEKCERYTYNSISKITLTESLETIQWLNTYGIGFHPQFKEIINQNKLDDFLIKLLVDPNHPNKVIALHQLLFVSIKVLKTDRKKLDKEQMIFIFSPGFIWSIQEKKGDYFEWIRERLYGNIGLVRKKRADYLLFLILESIIDNYQEAVDKYSTKHKDHANLSDIKPTPEFTAKLERQKQKLFRVKRAIISLRDTITKLEKVEMKDFHGNYFSELKEQATNMISDVEFEILEIESSMNLIYSVQGHKLNEVMKTLTIFSVIFIPLTFIAGIYGMNFENMPELKWQSGYFLVIGVMLIVSFGIIWYITRKKWF